MRALRGLQKHIADSVMYDVHELIAGAVPGPGWSRFVGHRPSPMQSASPRRMVAS